MNYIKKNYPNIYIIVAATSLALWFRGVHSFCEILVPTNLFTSLIYCLIPILVFILDDGSLSELHHIQEEQSNTNSYYAAGMGNLIGD